MQETKNITFLRVTGDAELLTKKMKIVIKKNYKFKLNLKINGQSKCIFITSNYIFRLVYLQRDSGKYKICISRRSNCDIFSVVLFY